MKSPKGLTLIELMATVAITGALMAAALGVVTRLSRADAIDERSHEAFLSKARLDHLLASDIIHAGCYRNTSKGVEFRLRARLDAKTLELQHLCSTVGYEVRQIAGRPWLLRIQKTPAQRDLVELVCPDVYAVALVPIKDSKTTVSGDWKLMPEAVNISVDFRGGRRGSAVLKFRIR